MEKNIKIYKTPMGDIMATEIKVEDEIYFLDDALSVQVTQGQDAQGQPELKVGFGSVAPFSKDATNESPQISIEMPYNNMLFAYTPNDDLVNGYLDILNPKRIVTLNNKIVT